MARSILDFLTEIRKHDHSLFVATGPGTYTSNTARDESVLVDELMEIKTRFLTAARPLVKSGIDKLQDLQQTKNVLYGSTSSQSAGKKGGLFASAKKQAKQLQKIQEQNDEAEGQLFSMYQELQTELAAIDDTKFKHSIVVQFLAKHDDLIRVNSEIEYNGIMHKVRDQGNYLNVGIQLSQRLQHTNGLSDKSTNGLQEGTSAAKGNISALLLQLNEIGGIFEEYQLSLVAPIIKETEAMKAKNILIEEEAAAIDALIEREQQAKNAKAEELAKIQEETAGNNDAIDTMDEACDR